MQLMQNDKLWYGEYGGCFVADAFSLVCDKYYKQYADIKDSIEFQSEFSELRKEYSPAFKILDDRTVLLPENYYSVLGTALLAKHLHKKQVLAGCRYMDEAMFISAICQKLGLNLKMYLTKELGETATLTSYLKLLGIEVNADKCTRLINHPEMYAFQEWLADSDDKLIINSRSNVGAFPQVNISSCFLKYYKKDFEDFLNGNKFKYNSIAVPVVSGSTAISIMDCESNIKYAAVECDIYESLKEEKDSFCGTFTKVMRNNYVDRVICPELADLYDKGRVTRKIADIKDIKPDVVDLYPVPLSVQSYALLSSIQDKDTLRTVKKLRTGSGI